MIRSTRASFGIPFLPVAAVLAVFLSSGAPAVAGTDVGINFNFNVGPPPVFAAPPAELVLIPGTGVYFVPDGPADVFFVDGFWWAPRGPRWYRGRSPRGPWVVTGLRSVPAPLFRVRHDYRTVYGHEAHIPYGQWKRDHGNRWGERRHWDRDDRGEGRHGRRGD